MVYPVHLRAQWPGKGDEHPGYTLHSPLAPLPLPYQVTIDWRYPYWTAFTASDVMPAHQRAQRASNRVSSSRQVKCKVRCDAFGVNGALRFSFSLLIVSQHCAVTKLAICQFLSPRL